MHFPYFEARAKGFCRKRVEVIPDEEGEMYVRVCTLFFFLLWAALMR